MSVAVRPHSPRRARASRAAVCIASALLVVLVGACAGVPQATVPEDAGRGADDLLIVDCLLPGQVRRLGTKLTYLSPRRPIKTTASICEIRGGEYAAYDRANFATALRIWLPKAEEGDPEAQTYVGEIYEKGLGAQADYTVAAAWYGRAAEQGHARANINLGYLYEVGLGVEQDLTEAMNRYRQASGFADGELEYVSSIEYANREAAKVESVRLQAQVGELEQALADAETRYAERQTRYERSRGELETLRAEVEEERRRVLAQAESADEERPSTDPDSPGADASPDGEPAEVVLVPDPAVVAENARLQTELDGASTTIGEREAELARLDDELARMLSNDAASRERKAALESRLVAAGDELEQARAEQTRLSGRLRDAELDAARRERGDAMIITGLETALAERERSLERQTSRIGSLEEDLARSETLLAGAPAPAERDRLQREVAEQRTSLESARAEQQRLTERLATEQIAARRARRESDSRLATLERQLAARETELVGQRAELVRLEEEVAGSRVQLSARDADKITSVVNLGPAIDIIDPPMLVTRGAPMLSGAKRASLELIGRVAPPESLLAFKINGATQPVSTAGVFRYFVAPDARTLELLAVDEDGVSTRLALDLGERGVDGGGDPAADAQVADAAATTDPGTPIDEALRDIDFGGYHALIVGNDDYQSMSDLNTAGRDARTVERLLRERYGFETELLLNATRYDMLAALNRLRETLTPEDNLLVYYAGHGELDEVSRRGYWLPVDAAAEDTRNWISNSAVTDQINAMAAKHVMVIADSCYSGTLTRSSVARQPPDMSPALRARWYTAMAASKVRTVLSSGGVRPVIDGAPGAEHSIFAQALIDELEDNRGVLEAYSLFVNVQRKVADSASALQVEQNPQYSPIRHSGHEAGEFVFVASAGTS